MKNNNTNNLTTVSFPLYIKLKVNTTEWAVAALRSNTVNTVNTTKLLVTVSRDTHIVFIVRNYSYV